MIVLKCQRRPVTGTEGRTLFLLWISTCIPFLFLFSERILSISCHHRAQTSPFPRILLLAVHSESLASGTRIAVANVLNLNYS